MVLALDAIGPSAAGQTATNPANATWSHTVTGTQTALLVWVGVGQASGSDATKNITGITYNGVAMTLALVVHTNNSTSGYLAVYKLTNPATGAHNVVVTFNTAPSHCEAGSIDWSGADQTTPFGTPVSGFGDNALATAAMASNTSGNQICFGVCSGNFTGTNPTSPATKRIQANFSTSSAGGCFGVATIPATGSSVTCSWAITSDFWALIAIEVKAAAGGASLTLGLVVETQISFPLTKTKSKDLGEPIEVNSAFAIFRSKTTTLGLPAEADTAFALTQTKSSSLGLVAGTDSALPLTPSKVGALGLPSTAEQALPLSGSKSRAFGLPQETGTPLPLTATKTLPLGLMQENDTVLGISFARAVTLGLVQETDTVFSLGAAKALGLGLPTENDSPLPLSQAKSLALGLLTEIDVAFALSRTKDKEFGLPTESDSPLPLVALKSKQLGMPVETDVALPLNFTGQAQLVLGLVVETESVFPLNATKTGALGLTVETDTTSPIGRARSLNLGMVTETGEVFALAGTKALVLGLASELDITFALDLGVVTPPGPVLRVYRHGVPIDVTIADLVVVRGGVAVPVVGLEVAGHAEG
jgi:hypothetical protein